MIRFWSRGTSSGPISTPRSPRATMTASASSRIASSASTAAAFSIFAITFAGALIADDGNLIAARERHRGRQVSDPELRSLQVGDQRERAPDCLLYPADEPCALGVLLAAAVGQVEPRGIHPGLDERAHSFF